MLIFELVVFGVGLMVSEVGIRMSSMMMAMEVIMAHDLDNMGYASFIYIYTYIVLAYCYVFAIYK